MRLKWRRKKQIKSVDQFGHHINHAGIWHPLDTIHLREAASNSSGAVLNVLNVLSVPKSASELNSTQCPMSTRIRPHTDPTHYRWLILQFYTRTNHALNY